MTIVDQGYLGIYYLRQSSVTFFVELALVSCYGKGSAKVQYGGAVKLVNGT